MTKVKKSIFVAAIIVAFCALASIEPTSIYGGYGLNFTNAFASMAGAAMGGLVYMVLSPCIDRCQQIGRLLDRAEKRREDKEVGE